MIRRSASGEQTPHRSTPLKKTLVLIVSVLCLSLAPVAFAQAVRAAPAPTDEAVEEVRSEEGEESEESEGGEEEAAREGGPDPSGNVDLPETLGEILIMGDEYDEDNDPYGNTGL